LETIQKALDQAISLGSIKLYGNVIACGDRTFEASSVPELAAYVEMKNVIEGKNAR
jgi:hypothetical protein